MLRPICLYILFVLLLITGSDGFSQQLKLGKNPSAVIKSAVLELESTNQGLLFPRLTDTTGINLFSPPDGMVIYLTTAKQLYVRSNGRWSVLTSGTIDTTSISNFYLKVRSLHAGTAPITYNNTSGIIGITQATTSTNGYLSSTDWNTFNNKLSSIDTTNISSFYLKVRSLHAGTGPITYNNTSGVIGITQASSTTNGYLSSTDWNTFNSKLSSITQGNLTETGSGILTITGGTNAVVGSGTTIQVKQASSSQNGFLSSTDWTTFNNKLSSVDTTNISNFYLKVRSLHAGTSPITYNNTSGVIGITQANTSTSGYLSNTDWNTFNNKLSSVDTTNISNFYLKVRGLHAGTGPITYNNTSGVIGITQASSTTNGYLSSTDWNTFNSKLSSITQGNLTETGSGVLTITGGTNAVVGSGTTIQVKQASSSQNGFLSSTDWTAFNSKLSTVDTTNISNFYLKVRGLHAGTSPITYNNTSGVIGITQANTSTSGYLSNTDWNTFNNKLSSVDTTNISNFYLKVRGLHAGTSPITYNNTSGVIGITQASSTTSGYLSSTDWNTFNSKLSSITQGNLTETGSGVLTITGGTNAVVGSGTSIQVKQASSSQNGFLSSTDWTTFNNKQPALSGTGFVKISGTTISYDNNTYLTSIDTTNITNFGYKVRTRLSGTAPITYNSTTGAIGITQASSTTDGYLSATDWTTFNNKLSSNNVWTRQGNAGTNAGTDFIGTTDAQDLIFKTNSTERWRIENSTGDIKIGDATSGTFKATKELVMREDGDTYGSSILRLRNRNAENGAIFETTTTDPGATLVDFIFKTSVNQRNIRYESRSTYSLVGVPAFHIGGSNPDVPTLAVGDNYAAVKNYLKVGAYTTPAEVLDVSGNVKLSGALMPGGSAGTSGQVLQSNGTGAAPTWVNATTNVTNDDYVYSYATATKTFSTAGTWADITINGANGPLSGWTHSTSSNTQNFTCNQTGVYQISYSGQVANTNSTVRELAIRAVLDGTEIAGSANSTECSSSSNTSLNNTFLVSITSGQVLKFQMTGSNTTIQLAAGGYGTTKPSISVTIIRIK